MKTILYSLIAIIIFGIVATSFVNKRDTKYRILIQSNDSNVSSALLTQSVKIISNRLKDFSSENFDITIFPENNQIQVILTNNWDLKAVENLLIKKGNIEFYETYSHKELVKLLNGNDQLFSLLNSTDAKNFSAKIGCTTVTGVERVNDYLNTLGLNQECKFAWNQYFDNSDVCLYALKTDSVKGAVISGTDIESIKLNPDKVLKEYEIKIELKKSAVKLWSDVTKRNINKAIAIVLDNGVISAPVVRSEINEGHCSITGDFTQTQARYIAALGNNGKLPVSFRVVK